MRRLYQIALLVAAGCLGGGVATAQHEGLAPSLWPFYGKWTQSLEIGGDSGGPRTLAVTVGVPLIPVRLFGDTVRLFVISLSGARVLGEDSSAGAWSYGGSVWLLNLLQINAASRAYAGETHVHLSAVFSLPLLGCEGRRLAVAGYVSGAYNDEEVRSGTQWNPSQWGSVGGGILLHWYSGWGLQMNYQQPEEAGPETAYRRRVLSIGLYHVSAAAPLAPPEHQGCHFLLLPGW